MLSAAVGAFFVVRHFGEQLVAPPAPAGAISIAAPKAGQVDVVAHVLATLAAVIGLGFVLGRAFRLLGQPPVIGEVVAGIVLGPSLLGAISPEAMHLLIPARDTDPHGQVLAALKAISQLGIVLYLFIIGLEMNGAQFRDHARATVAIAHAGIAVQFALGVALALLLYPLVSHRDVPFGSFALFLGIALSVTGFTVVARILADTGRDRTPFGARALGCAAADDVTAWCLVALAAGVIHARAESAVAVVAGTAAFIAAMFLLVRPLAGRVCRRLDAAPGPLPAVALPATLVLVLLAALTTELIGVHALIGAFLLGAVIPHDSRLAREFTRKLKDVVTVLLLPAFFALTGLRTEVGLVSGWLNWLLCGVILLAAVLGKFGGTLVAARVTGHDWRQSGALGAMMNTRGLMGLIVLDIGLGMGVISPTLFAMMVLMALATTLATAPTLRWLLPEPAVAVDRRDRPGV
jgi:Kef-type K+ transport system membrane component KefB